MKDLCKSCAFAPDGCWVALVLDGVAEGSAGAENIEVPVIKCEHYRSVERVRAIHGIKEEPNDQEA